MRLAEIGRRDEAARAAEQAVAGYRELATMNMTAYLPDLAMILTGHVVRLAEIGREYVCASRNDSQVSWSAW